MTIWTRFTRALNTLLYPEVVKEGAGAYGEALRARSGYSLDASMGAFGAFGWVYTCVTKRSRALASLPLVVYDRNQRRVESHPIYDLFFQPNPQDVTQDGYFFRQQWVVDEILSGNAFAVVTSFGSEPTGIDRLHPELVTIRPHPIRAIAAYEYQSGERISLYNPEGVLHVRRPAFERDARSLFGQGAIRALHDRLTAQLAADRMAANSATNGRPDMLFTPRDPETPIASKDARAIVESYKEATRSKHGGIIVVPQAIEVKQLSWTPKDLGHLESAIHTRDEILAVFEVPPSVAGVPSANYATAQQEEKQFWRSVLEEGRTFEGQYSRLVRMFSRSEGFTVRFDTSGVDALRENRTDALNRVQTWWLMGADISEAAAVEGLTAPKITAAPAADSAGRSLDELFSRKHPGTDPARRADHWRGIAKRLQDPAQKAIQSAFAAYLKGAVDRYKQRVEDADQRAISDASIDAILAVEQEAEILFKAVQGPWTEAARRSWLASVMEIGRVKGAKFDPRAAPLVALVQEFVDSVGQTTADKLRELLEDALINGLSGAEIQTLIQNSAAFAPSRALTVARTESTRAVNAGATQAYRDAEEAGVRLSKEWLSQPDARPDHRRLDGVRVGVDEKFKIGAATADAPGGFGVPEHDINCRCTVIPVVEED